MAARRYDYLRDNKTTKYTVRVECSHIKTGVYDRSKALACVWRYEWEQTGFQAFNPSTWFSGGRWVQKGNANIIQAILFLDWSGTDILYKIQANSSTHDGFSGSWADYFMFFGSPFIGGKAGKLDDLKTDARSVKKVKMKFTIPGDGKVEAITSELVVPK